MSRARIMIVEDEAIIAGEIRMILENSGYEVTSIRDSGQAAIDGAKSDAPDLVLMDINLKGPMDGIQAAAILRDRLDLPVIYLTASAEQQTLERAKQTRPAGYIIKPFTEQDVRVALEIGLYVTETVRKNDESRKRLAAAEQIAGFGACETDIETDRSIWSDEFFRICGYAPGAFEPDADMNARIIHPDDRERVAGLLERAIKTGQAYDIEKRIVRPDGTIRYVHSLGRVVRDTTGRPVRFIRTIHDITANKLLERQNRLNSLRLEIIKDIALLPDADEKAICDLVLERMRGLSGSRIGYLGFMTEDEQVMVIHAWSQSAMTECRITDKPIEFSIAGSGLWGEPVRHRSPIVINNYDAPHDVKKGCPAGHARVERFMSVPVFDGGRIVALAAVGNKDDAYTADDVNQLSLLMQGAWEQIRRKRADKAMAESEQRFNAMFEHMASGAAVYGVVDDGKDFIFKAFNRAAEKITRLSRQAAIGNRLSDRFPNMDKSGLPAALKHVWQTGEPFYMPPFYYADDERQGWRENRIYKLPSGEVVALFDDITERQKAMEALRKSEEQLRAVFEAAEDIAFIITDGGDPNPIIMECSPGAEKIFGYARQEMLGQSIEMFHQPDDFKRIPETRTRMRTGQKGFSGEFTMIRKSGEPFPALLTTYPLLDDKGHMFAALGIAIDISRQKKLEEQLRRSQRMEAIGTLAGGIAHDFNNILYPIIGHSEMLMEDLEGEANLQERVRSIMNSALRAADLVKQILSFSRQSKEVKKAVKIQETIHEVLLLIRHAIPAYIKIVLKIDNSCRPVMADAGQIHQVIMNLITNANHAMADAPGTLEIGLSEIRIGPDDLPAPELTSGRYVDLYVADTGVGITTEVVDRIFDPFFSTKEVGQGTGLGLSVSYGIVKQHDGVIRVQSQPGKGATFHVYLPAITDIPLREKPPSLSLHEHEKGRGEQILFVDDAAAIVELVESTLRRLGYLVISRTDSLAALETFRNDPDRFDLLITDMSMPDMTGEHLAGEIRKIRPDLPVILCTGFSDRVDEKTAMALGINAFLMKPVARDQLAAVVRRVLDERAGV